jgi:hypothetical protein
MDGLAHFGKRAEEISIEHLISKALVEAFDVPVLHRLAGLDVMEADLVLVAPSDELGIDEFGALSTRIWRGNGRLSFSCLRTRMTRSAGSEVSTSMARASRTP